ncbi:MAG TPA: hypothetical protein VJV39_11450 [Dongiaceae bacterium]|nr:hypothetical protein [Dongiaceae bacterium]
MMLERLFLLAMRRAARILFAVSILSLVGGFCLNIIVMFDLTSPQPSEFQWFKMIGVFWQTLSAPVLPFIGAAALHLGERYFAAQVSTGRANA